ncbi:glutamine-hydrolyzing carbamoyl-phosphate synthase small subunit [Brevibacillus humidisoli]|uniref:glutamine-hydrolyzing carbamoyl-phosphate synthase small subunit n=1 Tax=Brevibacillus humidisoli TaxID=2895522 RepID=UPI001E2F14DF|nr:glutamine-hydrolyzing carbamoyl-phosphate synthase small subunit [Brevibacillus humidisoli]UFJ41966.1 glutamine-hydrolyzing carbamoyl-phosphate synthase small subunit [Brevibacillus humidisoli]
MRARLLLEDGTECVGTALGAASEQFGEVVFNTGLTGYQEVLSDPSYCGQIVVMTYPLIGNYGINRDDFEAVRPFIHGFVVREHCDLPSNWRSASTLDELLREYEIPGIAGVDTRMLTRKIRHHGTLRGLITTADTPADELIHQIRRTPLLTDQVSRVSTKSVFSCPGNGPRVVLVDFGSKHGILRELTKRGCDVVVVPYDVTAEEIRRIRPDGVLLSNGPGDPKDVPEAIHMIRDLLGEYPLFGICLGHQLFALASGANTEKMKFGHRGGNHPVKELTSGRTYITSQNHGYAVTSESIVGTGLEITHIALNDGTIEGLRDLNRRAFSVQYHPEAAPGPYDSGYLFDQFLELIASTKGANAYAKTT